jgi:hypothetical protein
MGLLSSLAGIAAPIVGNIIAPGIGGAIGGAVGGLLGGSGQPKSLTATSQQQIDPRMDATLWGKNGSQGLIGKYQSYLDQPQSQALQGYGKTAGDYLSNYGSSDMGAIRNAATGLMDGKAAPNAGGGVGVPDVLWNKYVGVDAPKQNNIDLTGSYQNLLSGGNTAALDKSLQSAVNLTNQSFQKNQSNMTDNLLRNVMPSIRSNSVLAGQYGGSRQGVAEGNAISDFTKQLTDSNTTLGMANSANTTAQQAQAYQQGQDRALAATQGLGAQQYGVASQNAALGQASQFANQQAGNNASQFAASQVQNANQFNAGLQMQQNQLNNSAALGGAGLLSGLNGLAYGTATNADNYGINRATQVNGLLAPYLGANSSSTNSQPLYQNQAGNALGGALMGGMLTGGSNGSGINSAISGLFDGKVGDSLFKSFGLGSSL